MKKEKGRNKKWWLVVAAIAVATGWWVYKVLPRLSIGSNAQTELSPTQIQAIRDIGQWEFLAVSDEELVDTMRRGFFSDDHLVRIYYGTMRLGLDLAQLGADDVSHTGDTLVLCLPAVTLLDSAFIDEAKTKAFHETGRWTAADRERMYERAKRQMLSHGMSAKNIAAAQANAEEQFTKMLLAMGFGYVVITFKNTNNYNNN